MSQDVKTYAHLFIDEPRTEKGTFDGLSLRFAERFYENEDGAWVKILQDKMESDLIHYELVSRSGHKHVLHNEKRKSFNNGIAEGRESMKEDVISEIEDALNRFRREHQEIIECDNEEHDKPFQEAMVVGRIMAMQYLKEKIQED